MKAVLFALLLGALSIPAAQAEDGVGFKNVVLADPDRPLPMQAWYPTQDAGPIALVGENRVFHGVPVIKDARPGNDRRPLVLLSHGYGGSWRNLSWLAQALVAQGYVVAAPDHPGTTTFDRSPMQAAKLWQRPRDLSRVIDALMGRPELAGRIDAARIAAIGHSLGGWTVVAIGGGRFSTERFQRDCRALPNPRICGLATELGLMSGQDTPVDGDQRDSRVGAIVSLDLGLARGFTPESLAAYPVPALIIGAGVDIGDLPAKLESGYLAANLPGAKDSYVEIGDAAHFSFLQLCKPGAVAMIDAETPGDGIVCQDGGQRDRVAIHRQVVELVTAFLAKAIPLPCDRSFLEARGETRLGCGR